MWSRESSFKCPDPPKGRVTSDYSSIVGNDGHKVRSHSFSRLLINSWPRLCAARGSLCSIRPYHGSSAIHIHLWTLTKIRKWHLLPHSCSFTSSIFFPLFSYHLLMGTKPFPQLRSGHADGFRVKKSQCSRENKTLECVGGTFAHAHKTFARRRTRSPAFASKSLVTSITCYQRRPRLWRNITASALPLKTRRWHPCQTHRNALLYG